jgi:hypothetical protein
MNVTDRYVYMSYGTRRNAERKIEKLFEGLGEFGIDQMKRMDWKVEQVDDYFYVTCINCLDNSITPTIKMIKAVKEIQRNAKVQSEEKNPSNTFLES